MRLGVVDGEKPAVIAGESLTARQKVEVAARKAVEDTLRLVNEGILAGSVKGRLQISLEGTRAVWERKMVAFDEAMAEWKRELSLDKNPGVRPSSPRDEIFAYQSAKRAVELLEAGYPETPVGDLDCFLR